MLCPSLLRVIPPTTPSDSPPHSTVLPSHLFRVISSESSLPSSLLSLPSESPFESPFLFNPSESSLPSLPSHLFRVFRVVPCGPASSIPGFYLNTEESPRLPQLGPANLFPSPSESLRVPPSPSESLRVPLVLRASPDTESESAPLPA